MCQIWDSQSLFILIIAILMQRLNVSYCDRSWWEDRACCFALFVFLVSCVYCVTLPDGATGLSVFLWLWYFLIIVIHYFWFLNHCSKFKTILHNYNCQNIYWDPLIWLVKSSHLLVLTCICFLMNTCSYSWGARTFMAELLLWYCAMLLWREMDSR